MKLTVVAIATALAATCLAATAFAATKTGTGTQQGVRFELSGKVLTLRILDPGDVDIERQVFGKRVRGGCGLGGQGSGVYAWRVRRWRRGEISLTFRLPVDISRHVRICSLKELPGGTDIVSARMRAAR